MRRIAWYWLIVALVLGFRFGMDLQRHWDRKVMSIMEETIQGCSDVMDSLSGERHPKRPLQWTFIDVDTRVA